jgi:mRNA interferase HigB
LPDATQFTIFVGSQAGLFLPWGMCAPRSWGIVKETEYDSFNELKQHFRSADYVDGLVVFNISGNKYRLIAAIHFNRKKVYIRHILTHQEYDRGKWKRG